MMRLPNRARVALLLGTVAVVGCRKDKGEAEGEGASHAVVGARTAVVAAQLGG